MAQYHFSEPSVSPEEDSLAIIRVRARMDSIRQYRPTVAVVLGGGGAMGLAHLGVLRFIEEMGIPVDMVGGTSMGGLVSGLYSLGYDAPYLDSLVRAIDWTVMMSDKIPDSFQTYKIRRNKERFAFTVPFHYDDQDMQARIKRQIRNDRNYEQSDTRSGDMGQEMMAKIGLGLPDGFLFGFNVRNTLSSVSVGYQDSLAFDRLPKPFYCVATDILSLNEKNWTSGNIVDAMRSTMAIPGYFRPVRLEGMVLVDGGTRNNFPVDLAKAMGADIVIGSEMPSHRDLADLGGLANVAMQHITLMSADISAKNRKSTDILLQHRLDGYNMLSFDTESVDDIIRQGYALAVEKKAEFEEIARRVGASPDTPRTIQGAPAVDIHKKKVKVGDIRYEGLDQNESEVIINPALLPEDGLFGGQEIEDVLSALYGTKAFESVTYRLSGSQEPYTLIFDCQKGQTHEAGVGIHADGDEGVYICGFAGLGTRRLSGLRFISELKLGQVSEINLDLSYKPLGPLPVFGIALKNSYKNFSYWEDGGKTRYNGVNSRGELYFEDSRLVYGNVRLGFAADMEPYEYYDRDILVQAPADVVLAVASGEKTLVSLMDQSHAFGDRALAKAFDDAGIPVTKTRRVNPKKAAKKPEIPEEELKEALAAGEHTVQKALKKAEDTAKKTADKTVQAARKAEPDVKSAARKAKEEVKDLTESVKKTVRKPRRKTKTKEKPSAGQTEPVKDYVPAKETSKADRRAMRL